MLTPTNPRITAYMYVRDIVAPWMKDNPDRVNLDTCYSEDECGTFGCLGGWYCVMRYGVTDTEEMADILERDFGINGWTTHNLIFGQRVVGSLDDRLERIEKLIEQELVNATQ